MSSISNRVKFIYIGVSLKIYRPIQNVKSHKITHKHVVKKDNVKPCLNAGLPLHLLWLATKVQMT